MSDASSNPWGRRYSNEEWAAARRVGLAPERGRGPLIWAAGSYEPASARRKATDWKTVADALEREWTRTESREDGES